MVKATNLPASVTPMQRKPRLLTVNEWGLTAKQEGFAQDVALGVPLVQAYAKNYDVKSATSPTTYNAASDLAQMPKIVDRLAYLYKEQEKRMMRDAVAIRRHVFQGLIKESENEKNPAAARVRALELLGKIDIVSMFKDRTEVEIHDNRKPEDIENELKDKLRKLLG